MVIGVVYAFRLAGINRRAARLKLDDPGALAEWRSHRQRQYIWMIAAGWGFAILSIAVSAAVSASVRLTLDTAFIVQVALVILSVAGMITCAVISSKAGEKADRIESAREKELVNAIGAIKSDDGRYYYVKRSERNSSFYGALTAQQVLEELARENVKPGWLMTWAASGKSYNDLVRDPRQLCNMGDRRGVRQENDEFECLTDFQSQPTHVRLLAGRSSRAAVCPAVLAYSTESVCRRQHQANPVPVCEPRVGPSQHPFRHVAIPRLYLPPMRPALPVRPQLPNPPACAHQPREEPLQVAAATTFARAGVRWLPTPPPTPAHPQQSLAPPPPRRLPAARLRASPRDRRLLPSGASGLRLSLFPP